MCIYYILYSKLVSTKFRILIMDLTLKQIIEKIDNIHYEIDKLDISTNYIKIKSYIIELQNLEKQIGILFMKVSNVINICSNKNSLIKLDKQERSNTSDWTYLNRIVSKYIPSKTIANNIDINVKIVKNIDEIPNVPIYWVENINQFAVHINGVILRGNIGNIYTKKHIQKNVDVNQTIICRNGNACKNLTEEKNGIVKLCKFYHDPMDLLEAFKEKKISLETFTKYKILTRNYINTSWIYTELQHHNKNIMMRHFGSKNTLKHELELMKIDNSNINKIIIDNYRQQTMHDILVIMGLNQCGLLKEYPDLNMRTGFYDNKNSFSLLDTD